MRFSRVAQRVAAEAASRGRAKSKKFTPESFGGLFVRRVGSGLGTLYIASVAYTCTDGPKELGAVVEQRSSLVMEQREHMNRFALELDAVAGGADVDVDGGGGSGSGATLAEQNPLHHPAIAVRRFMQHEDERDDKELAAAAKRVKLKPSDLRHEEAARRELVEKLRVFNWRSAMAMSAVLDWRAASWQLASSDQPEGVWGWLCWAAGSVHPWVQAALCYALLPRATTNLAQAHRPYVAGCVVNAELLHVATLIANAVMSPDISDEDLLSIAPWLEDPRVQHVIDRLQLTMKQTGTNKPPSAPRTREWMEANCTEAQLAYYGDDRQHLRDVLKQVLTTTRPLPLGGEIETNSRGDEVKFVLWVVEKLGVADGRAVATDLVGPLTDMSRLAFFYGLLVLAREGLEAKRQRGGE